MNHRILLASLLALASLTIASVSHACHSCGGWGASCGSMLDVAPSPSRGELDALIACDRTACGMECVDYLDSYDACVASQDPASSINGMTDDCASCQAGIGAWSGIGCRSEMIACSYDTTCCTTCADWIDNAGDPDNLCLQNDGQVIAPVTSQSDAEALGACACDPAKCGSKCSAACSLGYFDPSAASFKCGACVGGGACSSLYAACSSL